MLRTFTLLAADALALLLVSVGRDIFPWGHLVHLEAPLVGVVLGLLLVGSYGRGEAWRGATRVIRGVGLGVLAAGWISVGETPVKAIPFLLFVWIATASVLVSERWLIAAAVDFAKRRFLSPERVLLVGAVEEKLDALHAHLTLQDGVDLVGRLNVNGPETDIWSTLQVATADTVVVAGELDIRAFNEVVRAATLSGCYLLSVSRYDRLGSLRPRVVWWCGVPFTELSLPELTAPQLALKRAVDMVGASLGLAVLAPVFLLIAILVKATSKGPVLFKQLRIGFGGGLFWMYKFRTMCEDADELKSSLSHLNASGDPRLFKIPEDPRITSIGKFLRRWSLDELPQLVNVLKGEMSLVGPRPFFEDDLEDYREEHYSRLAAKPGITGLWQVRGRSSILDFEEVVRLDLEYVDRWSLTRDLVILLETVPAIMRRAGAF